MKKFEKPTIQFPTIPQRGHTDNAKKFTAVIFSYTMHHRSSQRETYSLEAASARGQMRCDSVGDVPVST